MADSTEEYKDMFIEEAREHLSTLNESLLVFEKDPADSDAMNKIFRAAHTIKGMSATMNYDKIQKLSHKTEDTLDLIRNNQMEVSSEVIDLIFDCFDGIEKMVEDIAESNTTEFEISNLIEQLEKHMDEGGAEKKKTKTPEKKKESPKKVEEKLTLDKESEKKLIEEINKGNTAYKLTITISKSCTMKSIRSFLLLKKLLDEGQIITSTPEQKDIEDGKFDEGFEIYYTSDLDKNTLEQVVNSVTELDTKLVSPIIIENNTLQLVHSSEVKPSPVEDKKETEPTFEKPAEEKKEEKPAAPGKKEIRKPDGTAKSAKSTVQSIRIGMDQLDLFMNLIGELVINKGRLAQIALDYKLEDLSDTIDAIDRLTTELQDKILQIRMIPMKHVFDRFPRMIRDLARNSGKKVNLVIEGEGIELDRTILDEIGDPLVHLLRNSVDHGIEPPDVRTAAGKPEEGKVELIAERTRNHVVINITDDGKGIDPQLMRDSAVRKGLKTQDEVDSLDDKEALNLMFLPGLSSAEKVTNVSGRGVGMDVVKSSIEKLNGSVELTSDMGKGSVFSLRLPLTMAIFKALFVGVGSETYAIPINMISETINLFEEDIKYIKGSRTTVLRNEVLPLVSMNNVLGIEFGTDGKTAMYGVVVQKEDKKIGLAVDRLIGEQEITIKNVRGSLKKTKGIAGVTITGDGRVIPVIDINTLVG